MLNRGSQILAAWCLVNCLPGIASLIFILTGRHAPGLRMRFSAADVTGIEPSALATVDGLAVIANTLIAVYCVSAFFIVWNALRKGQQWALWVLMAGTASVQVAGYAADMAYFFGQNLLVLNISSLWLVVGFSFCVRDLKKRPVQTQAFTFAK